MVAANYVAGKNENLAFGYFILFCLWFAFCGAVFFYFAVNDPDSLKNESVQIARMLAIQNQSISTTVQVATLEAGVGLKDVTVTADQTGASSNPALASTTEAP